MRRLLAWIGVAGFPLLVLGALWFGRRDPAQPNLVLGTNMFAGPAVRPQSPEPSLPLGMGMQTPPEGTLALGESPFRYGATPEERKRAGRELRNPVPADPATTARGKRLYETFCLPCHGASGAGDGPLIPKYPNPPNFRSKQTRALTDGEMYHTLTVGWKKMASYASQLDSRERWEVIRYVRTLQTEGQR